MKNRSRSLLLLSVLFGYILLQFVWWEYLLVKQNGLIIEEKQRLRELSSTDAEQLEKDVALLHHRKIMQTVMIVSEGTVFLLLLLYGGYKIRQAHEKEQALNKQQRNFFLSITHELKTPIAATKLQLQTLRKQKLEEPVRQELIDKALLETERLNTLIDNVLLSSRMEAGKFSFRKERHNLSELLEQLLNRYYKDAITKGELLFKLTPDLHSYIDPNSFPSLLINLVDNALKYSPGEKNVTIELMAEEGQVVMRVKDRGCGIAPVDKEKIFQKFFRAGNEETRSSKGTGLGLYIVDYLVKSHQGKIRVMDNLPQGSIFEIRLYAA